MSAEEDVTSTHIDNVDVNAENVSNSEKSSDSGVEVTCTYSETLHASYDGETSPIKSITTDLAPAETDPNFEEKSVRDSINDVPLCSPVSISADDSPTASSLSCDEQESSHSKYNKPNKQRGRQSSEIDDKDQDKSIEICSKINNNFTSSSTSLTEQNSQNAMTKSSFSHSAENISNLENKTHSKSTENLDKDQIITEFMNKKSKMSSIQLIPENKLDQNTKASENGMNLDTRYQRIPKEILAQDIGSIVKNVHGIFSSVSGTLKYAYNQRTVQKPVKNVKPVPNGKVMNDIFEDEAVEALIPDVDLNSKPELPSLSLEQEDFKQEVPDQQTDAKKDVMKLQVETLERLLFEQRKENTILRERVKEQVDELHAKDQTFKELEVKLDLMSKRVDQAEREKDAAVMRYASVECIGIEARRAADAAALREKSALAEVELLNGKLKGAHAEKQRIIQLYDDKCHELQNCERELAKVREDIRELEGRLKWTQSKLRMEMDAYKDSAEKVEKLTQQVTELEATKEAAATNATDSLRAKQFEAELKECRAALILCRHEKDELDKRLSSTSQQLDSCKKERDDACASLVEATMEVEKLKLSNLRLEEEAAELAALRAKAALADTLSAQLQRESERALQAEEALSKERALAETCARREACALEHSAKLTALHVARRAAIERCEAQAQALTADNASLRERISALESESSSLRATLADETERRNRENRVLARKVAELTEELEGTNKKLEWEKGENGVLKKKHASAIKELNRELQRSLKRCEQLEAKLPPPDAPSTRTGSVSSLSSVESTQTEDRIPNGHETIPDIQVREPDRQALIERIVSLQRAAARRAERCEFLEEHSKQLTNELRNKSRLLRHMLSNLPAGAVGSELRDMHKKEIARLGGGAMAAVWGGDPNGMTLELSLEMNTRLQAVLEDTLLKNITLKENIDTLGAEISRLKEQCNNETKLTERNG